MNSSSLPFELSGVMIALAVVALFAGVVFWVVRQDKHKREARHQALTAMGFTRVDQPAAEIFERLETVYRHNARQKFKLRSLYERQVEDGKYLVFDLLETSGDDTAYQGSSAIAVLSPALHLPRANILGRLPIDENSATWIVKAAGKVLDWAISLSQLNRLSYEESPDIESKLVVMAEDELDTRAFFTEARLRQLTWLSDTARPSAVECSGDLFILQRQTGQARINAEQDFPDLLRDARRVWTALV